MVRSRMLCRCELDNFDGFFVQIVKLPAGFFGALILEHVSEIMADTCNVSTHQKNQS